MRPRFSGNGQVFTFVCLAVFFLPTVLPSPPPSFRRSHSPNQAPTRFLGSKSSAAVKSLFDALSLAFEVNQGQADPSVKFLSRGKGVSVCFSPSEIVFALGGGTNGRESSVMRMRLANANPNPELVGLDELPGKSNYFLGNDPTQWRTNVPHYAKVQYKNVYPGIDLVYYGNQGRMEYDFVVQPGADPEMIAFSLEGNDRIQLERGSGDLVLHAGNGEFRHRKPVVFQEKVGEREEIGGDYQLKDEKLVGFHVSEYDRERPLVIDPVLIYSTYFGGRLNDTGNDVAVDSEGNMYFIGTTASTNLPTANAIQPSAKAGLDAFVTKVNAAGTEIVFSTYLGGNKEDQGFGIAVDSQKNVYAVGTTQSIDFPVVSAFQPLLANADQLNVPRDCFITKISSTGKELLFSTYLGGYIDDYANGVAVDSSGNPYVTGYMRSGNILDPTQIIGPSAFVCKFSPSGTSLVYSTFIGARDPQGGTTSGEAIAVDSSGNAYVTGVTSSKLFPIVGPIQADLKGNTDAFITKINASGRFQYSTFFGGGSDEKGTGIAVDSAGSAYVVGITTSSNLPTLNPLQAALKGRTDGFVLKLGPGGNLLYSTYLGGSDITGGGVVRSDSASDIAVDSEGNAYVVGVTPANDFPRVNSFTTGFVGSFDAFIAKLNNSGSTILYSTVIGGEFSDIPTDITLDDKGNVYVLGGTDSRSFPTVNPLQAQNNGSSFSGDTFLLKIVEKSFALTVAPAAQTLAPGTSSTFTVGVQPIGGFGSPVNLTASVSPDDKNLTANLSAATASPGTNATLTVSASPSTPTNTYTVTITGDSGGIVARTTLKITVMPDFKLTVDPDVRSVTPGGSATFAVGIQPLGAFAQTVTLGTVVEPADATVTFNFSTPTLAPGNTATLTVGTTSATPKTAFKITVTGRSGESVRSASTTLNVVDPDFSLGFPASSMTLTRGQKGTVTVNINRTGGFAGTVTVTAPDVKSIKAKLTPAAQPSTGASVAFSLKTKSTSPAGSHQLVFTGKDDAGRTRTATLTLILQ